MIQLTIIFKTIQTDGRPVLRRTAAACLREGKTQVEAAVCPGAAGGRPDAAAPGPAMLGDIVISMPKAVEQAELYGHSLQREVGYLTAHSMFHLLGYDHVNGGVEAVHMREKEETVMTMLGLPRGASYVMDDENF